MDRGEKTTKGGPRNSKRTKRHEQLSTWAKVLQHRWPAAQKSNTEKADLY